MSEKWTKGPWTMETVRTQCGLCHKVGPFPSPKWWRTDNPAHACVYDDYPPEGGTPELVANAHLIAAAPDLYEALKAYVAADDNTGNPATSIREYDKNMERARTVALAALSRARGEQP